MLLPVLALGGCGPQFLEEEIDGIHHLWTRTNSNRSGTAKLKLPIADGDTALLATVRVDAPNQAHFRVVTDPTHHEVFQSFEWNDSPYSKTNAGFVADVVSLNWPVQEGDGDLFSGRWGFEIGVVDGAEQFVGVPVYFDAMIKKDAQFELGHLEVSVVYTDDLEDDQDLRAAVDDAKPIWVELYAAMGIDLTFHEYAFPASNLGPPAFGEEDAYTDISGDTAIRSVNLVFSETIEGLDAVFGIAGDIPGPLIPTPRSAVQISATLSASAGTDGVFDDEDIRLLAETMAHEVGHYLGLFHPVEQSWDAWDMLGDTPECDTEAECTGALGTNLMFPFPVCEPGGVCLPQSDLTDEQGGVLNRATAVE